jgi:preprotein translocase subunit YajC
MNILNHLSAWVLVSSAQADGVTTTAAPMVGQQPGMASMLVPFGLMFGVMYFLMIRPQQKKIKEQQALLASLKSGDEVLTSAGMIGTVKSLTEKVVTLEIAKNVEIKILKSQVAQVVKEPLT